MFAKSASEKFNFILKMLDKYTFNRFEGLAERLLRETWESLSGSKSERLIDNRVRGFFLAILDSLVELEFLGECKCGGYILKDDSAIHKTSPVSENFAHSLKQTSTEQMKFSTPDLSKSKYQTLEHRKH